MHHLTNIDFKILNMIQEKLSCSFLDFLMPKITFLGNSGLIWIITAILMLFFSKYRKTGITMSAGLCSGLLIGNIALKNIVARQRPCWINESVNMLIDIPSDYSFPSGHTLSSFLAATIIMHTNKKLGIAAYIIATLIAFSRLYLYVHFPSDVIAGALIGITIGTLCCFIADRCL